MTPRRRRMVLVGLILLGVGGAVALALTAFQDNLLYYYTPTQVAAGEVPNDRLFRVGGMVTEGSFRREPGSLEAQFVLTDYESNVTVSYTGVLPDLFREGQGIIARGRVARDGRFIAEEVLAKHDENYMPPDVADTLRKQGDKRVTTPIATSTVESGAE
ncbi:MAG: cytochrome c maturation protein CcmE [Xanthomonadaceae bacterium]|nr:cytochrome c maturation protein CcmE [Xanthomonadaceae bacterium]